MTGVRLSSQDLHIALNGLIWFLVAGYLVLCGAGCGEGDELPLIPPGDADMIADPRVHYLAPVGGPQLWNDVVWFEDGRIVIAGSGGALLVREDCIWREEGSVTDRGLLALAGTPDGQVAAAGMGGEIVVDRGEGWLRESSGVASPLRAIAWDGADLWAVGDAGVVVRNRGAGFERVPLPESTGESDLFGLCAVADTIYVAGSGGTLLGWSDGVWVDLAIGRLAAPSAEDLGFRSVAVAVDGTVFAVADSLYRRRNGRWRVSENWSADSGTHRRLKQAGTTLWLEYDRELKRVDTQTGAIQGITSMNSRICVAARAQGDYVLATQANRFIRSDGDPCGEGEVPGVLYVTRVVRLGDGTIAVSSGNGALYLPARGGLQRVPELGAYPVEEIQYNNGIAGGSLEDLFSLRFGLFRFEPPRWSRLADLPSYDLNGLVRDDVGYLYSAGEGGVYRWNGEWLQELTGESGDARFTLRRTWAGRIVAWSWGDGETYFREAHTWRKLGNAENPLACLETPQGDLVVPHRAYDGSWDRVPHLALWHRESGQMESFPLELSPGVLLEPAGGTDHATGLYIFTDFPSLVFHLEGDPRDGRWNLVAGPFDFQIGQLEVMDDGSLIGVDNDRSRVFLHRR